MGVKTRRVENYYKDLLRIETNPSNRVEKQTSQQDSNIKDASESVCLPEKWKGQIEKVGTLADGASHCHFLVTPLP